MAPPLLPRIDKLLFVASKADHVTPEQHGPLVSLLQHLVSRGRGQARFEGIETECLALAAIKATEVGRGGRRTGISPPFVALPSRANPCCSSWGGACPDPACAVVENSRV